ncbi:MAG: DUF4838 domain-containing protein, partial [Candidatus Pacebacteria bacterium]|nr:DUF4838 domain-containing protein [Candidatus Paceibacterota bacterium]
MFTAVRGKREMERHDIMVGFKVRFLLGLVTCVFGYGFLDTIGVCRETGGVTRSDPVNTMPQRKTATAGATMFLVQDGKAKAAIVLPDEPLVMLRKSHGGLDPDHSQRVAAEYLQTYVEKATGVVLPILRASEAPLDGNLVLIGKSKMTERYGIPTPRATEGIAIQSFDRGIALVGEVVPPGGGGLNLDYAHDRGTMHAVSIFLEKFLGFRFYFTDIRSIADEVNGDEDFGVVIPRGHSLSVDVPVNYRDAPVFNYRFTYGFFGAEIRAAQAHLMPVGHTDHGWGRYKNEHPEYFLTNKDGTKNFRYLCYSEPGLVKQRVQNLEAYYEKGDDYPGADPTSHYISIGPVDNLPICQCERCQVQSNPNRHFFHQQENWGVQSNTYFGHVRDVALEIKKRWPDKRIISLAYQGYTLPPDFDLPDNVDIMLCVLCPSHLYKEPEARLRIDELIKGWSIKLDENPDRLYIWDYPCFPGFWTAAPIIYPHLKQQWLQDYGKYIGGEYLNSRGRSAQECHWFINLWFRLLWDPELDIDAQLHDYCQKFFGPAASPMEKFYRLVIDRYENVTWSGLDDRDYSAGLYDGFYGETYTAEVVEQLEGVFNVAVTAVNALTVSSGEIALE